MSMLPNHLDRAEALLAPWMDSAERPATNRLDVPLAPTDLLPAVVTLADSGWGYLIAITGLDPGVATGALTVLYHFAEGADVVTLRVNVPRENPEVPTLRGLIPLAAMYEQELNEVLGVAIAGAPESDRLFLPDDWPAGAYPLRKDFHPDQIEIARETA